ncbi:MAG: aa3-type cytochrome c oxidase subunit IV [Alphaproteobacteria bacterium]
MATDNEAIARTSKTNWNGFCWFLSLATIAVALALGLMAIFLL